MKKKRNFRENETWEKEMETYRKKGVGGGGRTRMSQAEKKSARFEGSELASAARILKLKRYRVDYHGPCARMTYKFVKRSLFFRKSN